MKSKMKMRQLKNEGGFTLIEVIVSWVLVLLALLFVGDIIIFAVNGTGMSRIRIEISQKLEACKNELAGKPFDSAELEAGYYSSNEGPFKINIQIDGLSSTLKKVTLAITYKTLCKKIYFYKSKYIEEVDND
jgi:Tfp pilus assembly protein PilV